jgi:anti-sigma B factor antagonist
MPIHTKRRKGVESLQIEGDMTIYTAAALKKELMEHLNEPCEREIDLSEVGKMDSAGIQLLILAKREANRHNTPLRLIGHSQAVLDIFDSYNLAAYFSDPISTSEGARI